jgi:hypothetical protein
MTIKITDEEIINCAKNEPVATKAAAKLGIRYDTYKKHAIRLSVWQTNQGGKGSTKVRQIPLIETRDILNGKYPHYQRLGIKRRLFKEGLKEEKCEMCGIIEWNNVKIGLELDHINGNCYDHSLNNLRILCPNCHATTSTYRGRNKSKKRSGDEIGKHSGLKTHRQ